MAHKRDPFNNLCMAANNGYTLFEGDMVLDYGFANCSPATQLWQIKQYVKNESILFTAPELNGSIEVFIHKNLNKSISKEYMPSRESPIAIMPTMVVEYNLKAKSK